MEYWRHGRTVVPLGGIFENSDEALAFAGDFELENSVVRTRQMQFKVDEEAYLRLEIGDRDYFITYTALKDLGKLLKVPASFINKFPPSALMLENLNRNPYLQDENFAVRLTIWKWEEQQVIAGILPEEIPFIPIREYLAMQDENGSFQRETAQLDAIAITGEEVVTYFLHPEEINEEGFSFRSGYALHYSPTRLADTLILPFYKMQVTTPTGELFDFDFESGKKLRIAKRRKKDFAELTSQFATQYNGEDLGIDYPNTLKKGEIARQLSSVKFGLLKNLKSRATGIFSYSGIKAEPGLVIDEVIPEYKQFMVNNRERMKGMERYEINSILVDFYLPLYFNRIFTFQPASENPYFFLRYRKTIGAIFEKVLEEAGDVVL